MLHIASMASARIMNAIEPATAAPKLLQNGQVTICVETKQGAMQRWSIESIRFFFSKAGWLGRRKRLGGVKAEEKMRMAAAHGQARWWPLAMSYSRHRKLNLELSYVNTNSILRCVHIAPNKSNNHCNE